MESRYWRRQITRRGAISMAGAAAFAAACGGGGGDNKSGGGAVGGEKGDAAVARTVVGASTSSQVLQSSPDADPTGAKTGGIFVYPVSDAPITLDPHTQEPPGSHLAESQVYNTLWRRLEDTPGEPYFTKDLAESVEQTDQTKYTFKLAQGVKWQNVAPLNGRAFTAEDVKYNFARMATDKPEFRMRSMFSVIDKVETPDPNTVVVTTKFPYAPFITNVAFSWAKVVPRELVESNKIETQAVGTGPFILQSDFPARKDSELVYRKNPDYFRKGRPFLDGFKLRILPDTATRYAQGLAGDVDLCGLTISQGLKVLESQRDQFKEKFPQGQVVLTPGYASFLKFYFNMKANTPFAKDKRVRQAARHAINYDQLTALFSNIGRQTGPIAYGNKDWDVGLDSLPKYDLQKAKDLLAAAGFADGFKIQTNVSPEYSGTVVGPVVKQFLAALKIDVTVNVMDNAAWIAGTYRGVDFEMSSHADWSYDDPDRNLYDRFHSTGSANNTKFSTPDLDTKLEAQRREFDLTKRKALVKEIQLMLIDEAPEVWMIATGSVTGVPHWVKNYRAMVSGNVQSYRQYDLIFLDGAPARTL